LPSKILNLLQAMGDWIDMALLCFDRQIRLSHLLHAILSSLTLTSST
jgi:hypothetical protein